MCATHVVAICAYNAALYAFPSAFRREWGDDMRRTFVDRLEESVQHKDDRLSLGWLARELFNVSLSGLKERARDIVHGRSARPHQSKSTGVHVFSFSDIRYAFRLLGRAPGFTALTILVLAGGLGLSTFTFSFLHTAMIRPLPLDQGAQIVRIDPVRRGRLEGVDAADVREFRASLHTMRDVGGYMSREILVGAEGDRRVVDATVTDPVLFTVARTHALMGRTLRPADSDPGAEPVIVLSYRTWEVVFGADTSLLGRTVPLNNVMTRVVGVMPKGYGFPVAAEAWLPLPASTMNMRQPGLESLRLVARLNPDVSHARASSEATTVLQRLLVARDTAFARDPIAVQVESFPSVQFGEERALVFTTLNVLAALILLLALVNVTNLLLARANERMRETAVRLALGASTGRLVMQGMWETILLCLGGGIVGTVGAAWGLSAITRWTRANMEDNLAFWWVWQMDHITLITAGAFVTVAIAVLGAVLSSRTTRMNAREVMQDGSARAGAKREGRLSRILVITQVTTVTVLMFFGAMSGLIAQRAMKLDPGFDPKHLLQGGIMPPVARYASAEARAQLYRTAYARLAEDDAFDGVIMRNTLADQESDAGRFALRDARGTAILPSAHILSVLGDFSTVGVRVVTGRSLGPNDDASRAPVVLISQSLANRQWKGRSPIGAELRLAGVGDTTVFRTVVGVTSDVLLGNPLSRRRTSDAIYLPLLQSDREYTAFIARYKTTEVAGRQAILEALTSIDPLLMPDSVQSYEEFLKKLGLIAVSVAKLFAGCFGFALLLALVGTYGLMSRSIGLRTREVAVRRALGATDAGVTRLLLGEGGRQLGVGTLVAAPILLIMGLVSEHFVPISGWLTLSVGVVVSLSIVGLVLAATYVPARKTVAVSLRDALRGDG